MRSRCVLVKPEIVVNPIHVLLKFGGPPTPIGRVRWAAGNARLVKIDDEHAGEMPIKNTVNRRILPVSARAIIVRPPVR